MEDMAHYCDDVIVMNKGKILCTGKTEEVFSDPRLLSSAGLDVPAISKVAASLRERGIALDGRLYTVDGVLDAVLRYIEGVKK